MAALASFLLDCKDSKAIEYLTDVYGDEAFLVYVRLRQEIHSDGGYYCEWSEEDRSQKIFLKRRFNPDCRYDEKYINDVVEGALKKGIFDRGMYEKYHILTGKAIQENYIQAVARRKNAEIKPEYLLLNKEESENTAAVSAVEPSTNSKENVVQSENLATNWVESEDTVEVSAVESVSTNFVEQSESSAASDIVQVKDDCCGHNCDVVSKDDITVEDNVVAFKGNDFGNDFGNGIGNCIGSYTCDEIGVREDDYDDNNYNSIVDVKDNDGGAYGGTDFNAVSDVKNDFGADYNAVADAKNIEAVLSQLDVTSMQQPVTSMQHNVSLIEENRSEENRTEFKRERKRERSLTLPTLAPCGMYKNVVLKNSELDRLKADYPHCYLQYIDELSSYIESTGKKYSSHYATLLRWIKEGEKKRTVKNVRTGGYKPKQYANAFNDFSQRSYTEDDFREIIKRKGDIVRMKTLGRCPKPLGVGEKTLGRCPNPYQLLKKLDQNFCICFAGGGV
jgi:hypothetical protein